MGVPQYDVLIKLVKYAELNARGPSLRADSDAFRLRLQLPLAFNSAFIAAGCASTRPVGVTGGAEEDFC